jgi:hypothetical protein
LLELALGVVGAGAKETLEPLSLPDKRDPGFKNAVTKYLYSQHKMLTSLDMSDAGLVDGDVPRLSDAIGSNTVVKSVSLATNSLTHECMPDLVAGLEGCVSLRAIDLGENAIGVRGAAILARNLHRKTQLIGLDLASNLIRDEGCVCVCVCVYVYIFTACLQDGYICMYMYVCVCVCVCVYYIYIYIAVALSSTHSSRPPGSPFNGCPSRKTASPTIRRPTSRRSSTVPRTSRFLMCLETPSLPTACASSPKKLGTCIHLYTCMYIYIYTHATHESH